MKLSATQRRAAQAQLEALGWRTVDTGSGGFVLEPPERVKLYNPGFVYPPGHPGKLPPFPVVLSEAQ